MSVSKHDLEDGFRLDEPDILIRWGASVADVLGAFAEKGVDAPRQVSPLYYTAHAGILGGLKCQVGFHFEPKGGSQSLKELELFDNGERDIEGSYRLFHQRLVESFGRPAIEQRGTLGESMPSCEWRLGPVSIVHYAMDRFGPEEHLRIRKRALVLGLGPATLAALLVSVAILVLYLWL